MSSFKDGNLVVEDRTVIDRDKFEKSGFTRRDEADMAEQGKRQQFNVSSEVAIWFTVKC